MEDTVAPFQRWFASAIHIYNSHHLSVHSSCANHAPKAYLQTSRGHDSGARRRSPANRDSHAGGSEGASSNPVPANSVRRARESAGADAVISEGTGAGRLHLRHPESSRTLQVGRHFQPLVMGGYE